MAHTVYVNYNGTFVLINTVSGALARNTNCEVFVTTDRAKADEACAHVNLPPMSNAKRKSAHWVKSTFGVI